MSHINIAFNLPPHIKKGLDAGLFIRKGGVVLDSRHQVVHWLKEIPLNEAGPSSLVVRGTSLGKAALSAADFLYLHDNFKKIHLQLEQVNLKIDAQNLSKVFSGLKLAKEAELMVETSQAKNQITNARSLLEEGTNILRHILMNINKKEKNYREKRFHYLNLIIQAELGIIRSYLWEGEFEIARTRILQLKQFLSGICVQQLHDEFDSQHKRDKQYKWALFPAAVLLYTYQVTTNKFGEEKLDIQAAVKSLIEKNVKLEEDIEKLLVRAKEQKLKLSEEVQSMLIFKETLDGYELELRRYKEQDLKFIK